MGHWVTKELRQLFRKYFNADRVRFDTEGVIGAGSAVKTKEYITWISTPEEALETARNIILDTRNSYKGHVEWHDYLPNKKVAIFDGGYIYVKCMTAGGFLWVDIHLDNQICN